MEATIRRPAPRRAFTLVELLTVIVIIGILVGFISAAVVRAVRTAREAQVQIEIMGMDKALKDFKDTHGMYPPTNMADAAAVRSFLRRAFPRYPASGADPYTQLKSDLKSESWASSTDPKIDLDTAPLDPAEALVFWLGGRPDANGRLRGFSTDKENPFLPPSEGGPRTDALFDFEEERLVITTSSNVIDYLRYYPSVSGAIDADAPFVYFRASEYGTDAAKLAHSVGENVTVMPYVNNRNTSSPEYANPESFQILSAGMDNLYGTVIDTSTGSPPAPPESPFYPNNPYNQRKLQPAHFDNLTNFTEGKLEGVFE